MAGADKKNLADRLFLRMTAHGWGFYDNEQRDLAYYILRSGSGASPIHQLPSIGFAALILTWLLWAPYSSLELLYCVWGCYVTLPVLGFCFSFMKY